MANLGEAYVEVRAKTDKFAQDLSQNVKTELDKAQKSADDFGTNATKNFGKAQTSIGDLTKKALIPATVALGALATAGYKAAQAASDLAEEQSKAIQIFGEGAKEIDQFAKSAAQALGQSQQQATAAASTFGIFGSAAGLSGDALVSFSKQFVTLASDLASFNNTTPEEAITAIGAALRGEAEPIRRFGVLLDDATLKAKAMEMGLINTTKKALTPQQRALAASQVILAQTGKAQGDFARTSDGAANQQRILNAEIANASVAIGQSLKPILGAVLPILSSFAQLLGENTNVVLAVAAAIGLLAAGLVTANVAAKAWNITAQLTVAINKLLATSFTTTQIAMGGLGLALTAAAGLYYALSSSKQEATVATNDFTDALMLEGEAQASALKALLKNNPQRKIWIASLKTQGLTLKDINNYAKTGTGPFKRYVEALQVYESTTGSTVAKMNAFSRALGITIGLSTEAGGEAAYGLIEMARAASLLRGDVEETNLATQLLAGAGLTDVGDGAGAAADKVDKLKEELKSLRSEIKDKFKPALDSARDVLKQAQKDFDDFALSVSRSIQQGFSFGDSYRGVVEAQKNLTDATTAQTAAETALAEAQASRDPARIAKATSDLAAAVRAVTDAGKKPLTFFDQLQAQATKAKDFGVLVNRLIAGGLNQQALQQVLDAGVDAGSAIATEILSSADGVFKANTLVDEVAAIGDQVGLNAATKWKQAGVDAGTALVAGVESVISNYKIKLQSKKLTKKQLKKLEKDFDVSVSFEFQKAGAETPELANGAIVNGRQTAIIGERGPEAVIPITRPARALELMQQSGLASLAQGARGAAVNIENATFTNATDVDLMAQRVMMAERARSFGS